MTGSRSVFHEGELEVQRRAGVTREAARVGRSIGAAIPPVAAGFLAAQPFVVVASVAGDGRVDASVVAGAPGFLAALDATTLRIGAAPPPGDPLLGNVRATGTVGLLAIDFAARRRMRANGSAAVAADGAIVVRPDEVFSNCPKYIQARAWTLDAGGAGGNGADGAGGAGARVVHEGGVLEPAHRRLIEAADTFFIATAHPTAGADASHRGGLPGFVRAPDGRTLVWPDYSGNRMFQTLGNLAVGGRAGLLFLDFEAGGALALGGRAEVDWDPARAGALAGAERAVVFHVDSVRETAGAVPLRWRSLGPSPFNPEEPPPVAPSPSS